MINTVSRDKNKNNRIVLVFNESQTPTILISNKKIHTGVKYNTHSP